MQLSNQRTTGHLSYQNDGNITSLKTNLARPFQTHQKDIRSNKKSPENTERLASLILSGSTNKPQ